MAYLKTLRVLCSRIRLLFPVRSSSWRVAGSESGSWISVSSLQLRSTSYKCRNDTAAVMDWPEAYTRWAKRAKASLTLISGRFRISGNTVMWLECAMRVWSLLQLDTVEGTVFSLLPLRFTSSSSSSLLNLLKTKKQTVNPVTLQRK